MILAFTVATGMEIRLFICAFTFINTAGLWFVCIGYLVAFGYTKNSLLQVVFNNLKWHYYHTFNTFKAVLGVILHILLSFWEKIIQFLNYTTPPRYHGLATWWIEFVGNMCILERRNYNTMAEKIIFDIC
jgi:hypothetical protein